ncbi:MAG: helix-turn-helix domain-containing protein [Acidobacteriia bacterium]|nr:helix-turn-helix domain-containing protein [Terriglobia bacterium]
MSPLLDLKQAACLLSISQWTVRAWIKSGKLMPVRLGRRVLLEEAELQRLIREAKAHPDRSENNKS